MKKVVVADDEISLRFLISDTLALEDFEVIEAEDGEKALKSITNTNPDLIIIDIMMPKLSGYEVIKEVRNMNIKQPKIVVLTAKGEKKAKDKALEIGVDDFMTKPFSPLELLKRVEKVMDGDC